VRRGGGGGGGGKENSAAAANDAELSGILSPCDEFRLWAELASSAGDGAATAKEVYRCFEAVRPIFDDIAQQTQEAVLDLVDVTHDALEKVRVWLSLLVRRALCTFVSCSAAFLLLRWDGS